MGIQYLLKPEAERGLPLFFVWKAVFSSPTVTTYRVDMTFERNMILIQGLLVKL